LKHGRECLAHADIQQRGVMKREKTRFSVLPPGVPFNA
jgi:hypothetical protein